MMGALCQYYVGSLVSKLCWESCASASPRGLGRGLQGRGLLQLPRDEVARRARGKVARVTTEEGRGGEEGEERRGGEEVEEGGWAAGRRWCSSTCSSRCCI